MTVLPPGYQKGIDGTAIEVTRWCPTCQTLTLPHSVTGRCLFCDTETRAARGGWTRPDRAATSRISRPHALEIHAAHLHGLSLREIARQVHVRLGYASENSCVEGIRSAFAREGLSARSQPEATAQANRERA